MVGARGIDEILNKKDKIIIGTMLLFIVILMFLLNHFGYFENSRRDKVLNEEFKTNIIEKLFEELQNNDIKSVKK
jgi:hypothetical protein